MTLPREKKPAGLAPLFWIMHLCCLIAFFTPFRWQYPALAIALYFVRMFFITAGYHRYFSHRTYSTSRPVQFFIAFLAMTSSQKGVIWWANHHRHHHRHSDTLEDIHSPQQRGFWWSHLGWVLSAQYDEVDETRIRDLAKFPELRWLDRYPWVPPTVLGLVLLWSGGWNAVLWGFVISTVLLWHGTFTINSLSHVWGTRRFNTPDDSRNNLVLALITLGEGWHNNHHRFQGASRNGIFWWEIDVTYYVLKVCAGLGLIWDLHGISKSVLHQELNSHRERALIF